METGRTKIGSRAAFALILLTGVAGTGVAVRLLNVAGYPTAGSVTWIVGYGATLLVLWHGWFREIDISGQAGTATADGSEGGEADAAPESAPDSAPGSGE